MSKTPTLERHNANQLYADIFWFGVLAGSVIAFLSVYAARIQATSFQISLLISGPAVVNLLVSLPAVGWLENRSLIKTTFNTAILNRLGYFALIPLPWLLPHAGQVWAMALIALLAAVPGTLLAISFNSMFAEVVPARWRADVVGRRNALVAVSLTATTLLCGYLLDRVAFPTNYQLVFGIGAIGGAMTTYHLGRLRPLPSSPNSAPRPVASSGSRLIRLDLLRTAFGPMLFAYFAFYSAQNVPVPINPLFWVNDLGFTDGVIGLGNSMFYAMMTLASMMLSRLTARYGNRRVLVVSALFYSLYPLFTSLAQDTTLFWAASIIGGAVFGFANGGLLNRLLERVPPDDRPAHMAWHNVAFNLGILGGSLLGAGLSGWAGLRNGLMIAAALRFLAGLALALWA
ncbi:MAG: MFS transporter [Chloroflexi bacterium]|nr:MFS transporter [Chloroflexota bacterium]